VTKKTKNVAGARIWFTVLLLQLNAGAHGATNLEADEHLGTVSFRVSCSPRVSASFNRGIALLHDFWYEEARPQFEKILAADPSCAMAHWGVAMSGFHQIWDRPDEATEAAAWREMQAAQAQPARTSRERQYIEALAEFFRPGHEDFEKRIETYATAMGRIYIDHPEDVDAGAFYALALLAAQAPNDNSLVPERKALAVLEPLWKKNPDHPGLVHYIIHACDTPSLASEGLAAARHYGEIAPSGPHAVHMPGHIFARLGMWQEDIAANLASVAASQAAEARHESGWMDQFHSDDFLVYAYLQSGQEARARAIVSATEEAIAHFETMPGMAADHYMTGMFPNYRVKLPIFVALETRDWSAATTLQAIEGAPPETQTQIFWARAIAAGHLHQAAAAKEDLTAYDAMMSEVSKGRHAYYADGTDAQIRRGEILAWIAFADGQTEGALKHMSEAADLQDKVGQSEVDIPAREMLADILLESHRPREALSQYKQALNLSPNRLNGLLNAGKAAEAAGDAAGARRYYTAVLKSTDNGSQSSRPEFAHARALVASANR
jgi:tetratricopeptide (TPR) repeat protein